MTESMVERIARALCDLDGRHNYDVLLKVSADPEQVIAVGALETYRDQARTAIKAMRETGPTQSAESLKDAIVYVCEDANASDKTFAELTAWADWVAMIDGTLSDHVNVSPVRP